MTKQEFLQTGYFIDNKYLDQYLELIEKPFYFTTEYEEHHIIPVSYYKIVHKCKTRKEAEKIADNRKVKLTIADHCTAHWLLYKCTRGLLKELNGKAFIRMTGKKILKALTKTEYTKLLKNKQQVIQQIGGWKISELVWLQNNYSKYTAVYCASKLHKSVSAVENRLYRLNLKKRSYSAKTQRNWEEQDLKFLIDNYKKLTTAELAKQLNRTEDSISTKIQVLKIASKRDKHVVVYCPELDKTWYGYSEAARATGIAMQHIYWAAVKSKAHRTHGLTFIKK